MKSEQGLRGIKKVSLNQKELNGIWLKCYKNYGELGDSATIKGALKDAIKYNIIKQALGDYGIDLYAFVNKLTQENAIK